MDSELLASVAIQMMSGEPVIRVRRGAFPVNHSAKPYLLTVSFPMNGQTYQAIEQNRDQSSPWGRLARIGHQVVQFKHAHTNRFVAVFVDGRVMEYGTMAENRPRSSTPA